MNKYAMVIGTAFVLVTVFSAVTLVLTVDMYQAFTETKNEITPQKGNIFIKDVRVPPISGTPEEVRVTILVEVNNPTRLDIWVYNIEFTLFMFNETTEGNIGNPQAMEQSYVRVGGFFREGDPDYLVPSGENATLESSLAVTSPLNIAVLNTTDAQGKYRPFVSADLRYEVVDLDLLVTVRGIYFYGQVDPYEG